MREIENLPEFARYEAVPMLVGQRATRCIVARPSSVRQCREMLAFCRDHKLSICPRGSGRSYGDAILNDRQLLLDMSRMNAILAFDPRGAQVTVEPGARIIDILRAYHALGFTVPASPTDSSISVCGAMSANVNGKDSWRVGNFGDQVVSFKLLTAAGEILHVDRNHDAELFHAVIGGMGMLGLVVEITLQMQRVPSPFLEVSISTADNLAELIEKLDSIKQQSDFVVVWIDSYAKGAKLGRSVIHATKWLPSGIGDEERARVVAKSVERLATQKRRAIAFFNACRPLFNFGFNFQKPGIRLFNALYFQMHRRRSRRGRKPGAAAKREMFLEHNFDKSYIVPPPDVLCGPHGYTVQMTVPYGCGFEAMREILESCRRMPCPPATTILRLHRKDCQLISFSENGYSLNFEFHPQKRNRLTMRRLVGELIDSAIRFGSRIHLPKDSVLTREQFKQIYPRFEEFAAVKRRIDPTELFQSDMYRRLFIDTSDRHDRRD